MPAARSAIAASNPKATPTAMINAAELYRRAFSRNSGIAGLWTASLCAFIIVFLFAMDPLQLFRHFAFFSGSSAAKDRAQNQPDSAGHKQAFARIAPHLLGDVGFDFFRLHLFDVIGGVMKPGASLRPKVRRLVPSLIVFSLAEQSFGGLAQFVGDPDLDPFDTRPARFNLTLSDSRW